MIKTLISMSLGLCLPGLAFIAYNAVGTYETETNRFQSEIDSDLNILAFALVAPLWDFAPEAAREVLEKYFEDPEVISLKVFDDKSESFFELYDETRKAFQPSSFKRDVLRGSKKIGSFELVVSSSRIMRLARQSILHDLAGLCSLLLAAFLILYFLFKHLLLKRLKFISDQAKRMVAGELQSPFEWEPGDEINELGMALESARQTLSRLILDLKSNQNLLESANQDLEVKIDEKAKQLIQSAKMSSLGEMAAGIAHEINNPLTIIQGKASLLLNGLSVETVDKDKVKKHAERIIETTERIAKIVRGLRNFSRSEDGDPFQAIPLKHVLEDALSLCAERIKQGGVSLRLQSVPDLQVSCRSAEISQVLINLLNNAFDAIQDIPEPWISIRFEIQASKVSIFIQDCGKGISPEVAKAMMQPFFTTKEVGKGTGLGLSISTGIVENHKGRLWYDNSKENTTFIVEMPIDSGIHSDSKAQA